MTREEFIGKLQMVYVGNKNASADIISEYDRLNNIINEYELYLNTELQKCGGGGYIEEFLDKLKALKENNK